MKFPGLHITLLLSLAFLTLSCEDGFFPYDREEMIVEGWIEADGFPVVMVTKSLPVRSRDDGIDFDELSDYVVKWANITVSDGEKTVTLTGTRDKRYVPGFIYTTGDMKGEAGKTYTLTVRIGEREARSVTTIPLYAPTVDSLVCRELSYDTARCEIVAYVRNNPDRKEYFKSFYTIGPDETQYLSSFLGMVDDALTDSTFMMPVIRDDTDYEKLEKNDRYFPNDTLVGIKISALDSVSYEIWKSFEDLSRFSSSFYTASIREIPTNISGGQGYWCGYNSYQKKFIVSPQSYPGNN